MSKEKEKKEQPIISWDTCAIIKNRADDLIEQNKGNREDDPELEELDEDEAWRIAAEDSFIFDDEWEYVMEYLTEIMTEINPDGGWFTTGENMGWQHRSGYKSFKADDGEKFMEEILPKTDCTFHIYRRKDNDGVEYLYIRNAHHDAPTGEFYTVYPAKMCEHCGEVMQKEDEKTTSEGGIVCELCYDYYYKEEE
jgi:hypothetical protein